jgi:hypothetical protein
VNQETAASLRNLSEKLVSMSQEDLRNQAKTPDPEEKRVFAARHKVLMNLSEEVDEMINSMEKK